MTIEAQLSKIIGDKPAKNVRGIEFMVLFTLRIKGRIFRKGVSS